MLPRKARHRLRAARPAARPLIPATSIAAASLAAAILVAGCAEDDAGEAPVSQGATELTLTLDPDGDGQEPLEALVECPGGAAPPTACDALAELPEDPGAPTPPDTPCTEIYGGPDILIVEGTLEGDPIDAELTRANGCEIDRFDAFLPVIETLFPDYRPGGELVP